MFCLCLGTKISRTTQIPGVDVETGAFILSAYGSETIRNETI